MSGNQKGVILPRLGDGATSHLWMRACISNYEECKKIIPAGSALYVKALVKEERLELICDEYSLEVPLSDASRAGLIKAVKKREGTEEELSEMAVFVDIVHAEVKMDPGEQRLDRITNLKDFRGHSKRHGRSKPTLKVSGYTDTGRL